MTRPDWCPPDVWGAAQERAELLDGSQQRASTVIARAILIERERCRGVANERAAQLWAGIQLPSSEEAKAGWAGQMIEALAIEQRISQGHAPKQAINIEGLHEAAAKAGFQS